MTEAGSLLDDAELEGIRVTVEIDAYDVLCRARGLTLSPETVPPGMINTLPGQDRLDNGLTRGIYQSERATTLGERRNNGGEKPVGTIGAKRSEECVGDIQLRGAGLAEC
jgi:hypothetical protein